MVQFDAAIGLMEQELAVHQGGAADKGNIFKTQDEGPVRFSAYGMIPHIAIGSGVKV